MTKSIMPWCEALKDSRTFPWVSAIFTHGRVLDHVNGTLYTGAEFFIKGNGGLTTGEVYRSIDERGLRAIACMDNFLGNGRGVASADQSNSPVKAGEYHRSHDGTPGKAQAKLEAMLNYPADIKATIEYWELLNEAYYQPRHPDNVPDTMLWSSDFLWRNHKRIRNEGWKIMISAEQAGVCHRSTFDTVTIHPLGVEPAAVAAQVLQLKAMYPDKEIMLTEQNDPHPGHTGEMVAAAIGAGAYGVSGWAGNTEDFPGDGSYEWNGKRHPYITHLRNNFDLDGNLVPTQRGVEYAEALGIAWPVEPPIDPPVPVPPIDPLKQAKELAWTLAVRQKTLVRDDRYSKNTFDNLIDALIRAIERLDGRSG